LNRNTLHLAGTLLVGVAGWQASAALESGTTPVNPKPAISAPKKPIAAATPVEVVVPKKMVATEGAAFVPVRAATPMEQREAVIGILNKRNGLWRDLHMKPGEAVHIGDAVVRLRACETTAAWENDQYTGAFVQLIVRSSDDKWRKVFSGWLYRESPSLNVVENPIYDVWVKSCTMRYPEAGSDTVVVHGGDAGPAKRSKAKKSGGASVDEQDSADLSNPT
jgi:hypothetical protein